MVPRPALAERSLTLDAAIRMALEGNQDLRIEREGVRSANAGLRGARGAYDPVLELSGGWSRTTAPVNSAFSGAPPGRLAPELESLDGGGSLHQLLPTGGALSVRALASRATSDGIATLLSPAYDTQVGVELRQPLLRDLGLDDARLALRVASTERRAAVASLRSTVSETVAAVEKAYWDLVAARQGVGVREDAVRLAEQQLDETRTRVETGSTPRTELSQPIAELARRHGDLLVAVQSQARSENALKLLILGDAEQDRWLESIAPSDSVAVSVTPVDHARALRRALASRPELAEAEAAVERRHAETARAWSGVLPALDAVVSYDRFGLAGARNPSGPAGTIPPGLEGELARSLRTLRDGDLDATRVGVVLGLPITNRSARAAHVVAQSAERQAEAALSRVRSLVSAEVLDALAALDATGQRIE